jgi:hypothetical protein
MFVLDEYTANIDQDMHVFLDRSTST